MLIELGGFHAVHFIGDPHLGRRFENGVPLHRRGEREKKQLAKFKAELEIDCAVNIMVGDLFDHPQVAMSTILEAADAIELAAGRRPDTDFFLMAGNHDRSRQLNTIGAWEVFSRMMAGRFKNVFIVSTVGQVETIAFFPWEWGKPVIDQLNERFPEPEPEIHLAVLHHDLESFGGNTDYMVPAAELMKRFPNLEKIVTGHWHLEGEYKVDGVDVSCTGSLEPYTHAEDPDGGLYVTLTLDEFQARDPAEFKDKCVRISLREGEELPVDLDCLALTGRRLQSLENDEPSVAEKLGAFDWKAIMDECLKDVPTEVREFIDDRLQPTE